jgi:hypothetical protein
VTRLHNVSAQTQLLQLNPADLGLSPKHWRDMVTGKEYAVGKDGLSISLPPYGVCWLEAGVPRLESL